MKWKPDSLNGSSAWNINLMPCHQDCFKIHTNRPFPSVLLALSPKLHRIGCSIDFGQNFTFQLSKSIFSGFEDLPPSDGTNHPGVNTPLPGDVTLQLLHVHYNFPSYRFRLISFVLRCNLPPSSRRSPRCSPSDSLVSPPAGTPLGDFLAGTPLGTLLGDFLAGTLPGDPQNLRQVIFRQGHFLVIFWQWHFLVILNSAETEQKTTTGTHLKLQNTESLEKKPVNSVNSVNNSVRWCWSYYKL